jgi:hypothetical protein
MYQQHVKMCLAYMMLNRIRICNVCTKKGKLFKDILDLLVTSKVKNTSIS